MVVPDGSFWIQIDSKLMLIRLSFSLSFSLLVKGRLLVIYVKHHLLWPGSSRQNFATGFLRYLLQLVYISTHRSSLSLSSTITRRHTRQPILPSAIPALLSLLFSFALLFYLMCTYQHLGFPSFSGFWISPRTFPLFVCPTSVPAWL